MKIYDYFDNKNKLHRRSTTLTFIFNITLPILLLVLNISCSPKHSTTRFIQQFYSLLTFDFNCLALVLAWLLIQIVFILPINIHSNQKFIKIYSRWNGLIVFIFCFIGIYLLNKLNIIHACYVFDNISKILISCILVSYSIAFLLFIKHTRTRCKQKIHSIIAFFYGTQTNLSIIGIDLNRFFELRVGLIGWACLNLCFLFKTFDLYTYRRPPAVILVIIEQILQAFQMIWYEQDRIQYNHNKQESIGFLRIFGCLCWFPFLWCMPTQYLTLVNYPVNRLSLIASIFLFILGMLIYRSVHNQEKLINIKPISSNYWSLCCHPYYLGNMLILLSWSVPCGLMSIPWILPVYYLFRICQKSHLESMISL